MDYEGNPWYSRYTPLKHDLTVWSCSIKMLQSRMMVPFSWPITVVAFTSSNWGRILLRLCEKASKALVPWWRIWARCGASPDSFAKPMLEAGTKWAQYEETDIWRPTYTSSLQVHPSFKLNGTETRKSSTKRFHLKPVLRTLVAFFGQLFQICRAKMRWGKAALWIRNPV